MHFKILGPESVQSLTVAIQETNINVRWETPVDYKPTYRYNFTWQQADGGNSNTTILKDRQYNIDGLNPGSRYNFSVTTETSDGTQGEPISSSSCTSMVIIHAIINSFNGIYAQITVGSSELY